MPLDTLGRTRTTMPAAKRCKTRLSRYPLTAGVVGIGAWNCPPWTRNVL